MRDFHRRGFVLSGLGLLVSAAQAWHSWNRSFPSAPEVQKNSLSCVIRGSGRPGAADTSPPSHGPALGIGRAVIRIGELRYHLSAGTI